MTTFAKHILDFYFTLPKDLPLPNGVETIYPFDNAHINGIESFWSYAKIRLVKFRGIRKSVFYFHLKECEFRFTIEVKILLEIFRKEPLKLF